MHDVCYALTPDILSCRELTTQWFGIRDWWPLAPITDRVRAYKNNSTRTLLLIDSERHAVLSCALVIQCKGARRNELGTPYAVLTGEPQVYMNDGPSSCQLHWQVRRVTVCIFENLLNPHLFYKWHCSVWSMRHEHLEVWFDHSCSLSPSVLVKQNSAAVFNEHAPVEGAIESIKGVLIPMW